MAVSVRTRPLTRDKIASFLKSQELIKAFENLTSDVGTTLPAAIDAASTDVAAAAAAAAAAQADADALEQVPYVTMALSGTTANERTLAVDPLSLKLTDGGAGNAATLATADLTAILGADISDSTAAFVNATGLALALLANATYLVDGLITFQSGAVTTGIGLCFTLPAGASISGLFYHNSTATFIEGSYNIASGVVKGNTSGVLVAGENVPITGRWIIKTGATAGNAQLQFRSEVAASAVALKAGLSAITARRIA